MSTGLAATFQFLAKTENEAAVDVLVAGLECPYKSTQYNSLRAVLDRRSPEGHRQVFRRLSKMDERSREIINDRPERLAGAVTEALQDPSQKACESACNAIVAFRLYESLPTLVSVLVDSENSHTETIARTILKLAELFYAELSGTSDEPKRKQQGVVRDRITSGLEDATRKFHRHQRIEVVEAFLLIAKQKNITLRQLLQRPSDAGHRPIIDVLSNSERGGVIRLLLGFLEDPQMPHVVAEVLTQRCDAKFVDHLLRSVGPRPSKTVDATLKRFESIAWAKPGHEVFDELSDEAQQDAVHFLMASSMDRSEVLEVLGYLLLEGRPAGRRAAAGAMEQFEDPQASVLVVRALNDEDPQVRAALIVQLRQRQIPGAFSLLIRMVDNPPEEVQAALRKALPEFTLRQFLPNFDSMPEAFQPLAGHLVRKIDPKVVDKIAAEMNVLSPVRRRRAVKAAAAMGLVQEMEETVVRLLTDDDHMVRAAAAKSLADCKSMPSWEALRDALLDSSFVVKEAAEKSLEQISRSLKQDVQQAEEEPQEAEAHDLESLEPPSQLPEEVT